MTNLSYGQKNGLRSALQELALKTEELAGLLNRRDKDVRIIAVHDGLSEPERKRCLDAVEDISKGIHDMCEAFGLDFDPIILRRKLQSSRIYMQVVIQNVRPSNFRGYGCLSAENESLLSSHIDHLVEVLNKL
jgi:hypothetical protein